MLLPWEYGVRNLARRPVRTGITLVALATVVLLVLVVVGFIRGLEQSLVVSGDPDVALVYSVNSESSLENSAIAAQTPGLLTASLDTVWSRYGVPHVSPELYLGTRVQVESDAQGLGLVRGVTRNVTLVRRGVHLLAGEWPKPGEALVGRLAATKLGVPPAELAIGKELQFEGASWKVCGTFTAQGATYESEIWCNLDDFQNATRRQDLSLVAVLLEPGASPAALSLFCKERLDLELRASPEVDYYASLQRHYQPVRWLAWTVVLLVAGAGVFAGLNLMYGAVAGRTRELAALQAIGFRRSAILFSLVQEGMILAAAASILAAALALALLSGTAVRFTMGAFPLRLDGAAILWGCSVGLAIGVFGALPPALKALRASVADSLKSI